MREKDRIFGDPRKAAGEFTFNQEVVEVFDDMIVRSVPFYHEIQQMTVEIAAEFAQPGSRIYDLGCSTGKTLSLLLKAVDLPNVRFIGIDNSDAMLRKAKERLSDVAAYQDLDLRSADLNSEIEISRASVVILNWTLQFVGPRNRTRLIRQIFDGLTNEGCLIIVEKIAATDSFLNALYIEFHHALKRRHGYSDLEIARKREALDNVLIPFRIEETIALLQAAGFSIIDVFFRWFNFAGLIAIKR